MKWIFNFLAGYWEYSEQVKGGTNVYGWVTKQKDGSFESEIAISQEDTAHLGYHLKEEDAKKFVEENVCTMDFIFTSNQF